ncbi:hypothetical protein Tco_0660662 [Tanacetum coccineum]
MSSLTSTTPDWQRLKAMRYDTDKIARTANPSCISCSLQKQTVYHPPNILLKHSIFLHSRNSIPETEEKAICYILCSTYDPELLRLTEDDELSKGKGD